MSQTITITDATASDLTQALAHPTTPPPNPTPQPPSTMTAPFVVDSTHPLATIVTGPDGPLLMLGYDTNTKVPWLYLRTYLRGDSAHGIYSGSFIVFQCVKSDGTFGSAVTLNGGYVGDVPGKENGDLDIIFPVDGVQANVSVTGKYTPVGALVAQPPGVLCWPPDLLRVGSQINRFAAEGMTILPVRAGMPAGAIGCVDVGGGFVPVYA